MSVNRKRVFQLPDIDDLSKDQDRALSLPLDGAHLMVGGPGTGKSIVCLLRARTLAKNNKSYLFLVYNHMLKRSNDQLFNHISYLHSTTWMKWIFGFWRECFHSSIPTGEVKNGFSPIDWDTVIQQVSALTKEQQVTNFYENFPYLIIDEGQDLPQQLYEFLDRIGFNSIYVAADENQQINENNSTIVEIQDELDIDEEDTIDLTLNYRNALPIAKLSHHFFLGRGSKKTELPDRPSAFVPLLIHYGEGERWSFEKVIYSILRLSDRQPNKLIGIITPDDAIRIKFYSALNKSNVELDNGRPPLSTYTSQGSESKMDFGSGGIMVINAQSCKGLEFDIVFLADIDKHQPIDESILKPRFYVMVTRAKERVIMLRTGEKSELVDKLLPEDEHILQRKV